MKPTDEQVKEFWERCGFTQETHEVCIGGFAEYDDYAKRSLWFYPGEPLNPWGKRYGHKDLPPIDLNNLFKYAVPKLPYVVLENCQAGYSAVASADMKKEGRVYDEDPADALFWAIWKV